MDEPAGGNDENRELHQRTERNLSESAGRIACRIRGEEDTELLTTLGREAETRLRKIGTCAGQPVPSRDF